MDAQFHPAKARSVGELLLDVALAATMVATLVIVILTVLSDNARDELARAYARQFRVATENDCPAAFGNDFWFACAAEVRRINPPPPAPSVLASQTVAPRASR